jgi:predicted nucleic acid-binding protein
LLCGCYQVLLTCRSGPTAGWAIRQDVRVTRYVIGPDVAVRLAQNGASVPAHHQLLAPALIRSQLLSRLYQSVRNGEITKRDAERQLDHVRSLRLRLLGDRVLQSVAWKIADQLGWPGTFDAEYLALTQLQADAFVTLDKRLIRAARGIVPTASIDALEPISASS